MEAIKQPYTENFDTLVALVTHLSNTRYESRTIPTMAADLGLDEQKVRTVLEKFPAFFRKSRKQHEGEYYYTVHLRYARRSPDESHPKEPTNPLKPEELSTLLDLISKMLANENATVTTNLEVENAMSRLKLELQQRNEALSAELKQRNETLYLTSIITMIAALIAAAVTLWSHA